MVLNADIHFMFWKNLIQLWKIKEAIEQYDLAGKAWWDLRKVNYCLWYLYEQLPNEADKEQAVKYYQLAIEDWVFQAHWNLWVLFAQLWKMVNSINQFELWLKTWWNKGELNYNIWEAYEKLWEQYRAIEYYKKSANAWQQEASGALQRLQEVV